MLSPKIAMGAQAAGIILKQCGLIFGSSLPVPVYLS